MKDLRIPTPSEDVVELSAINRDFPGLVIGYNGQDAVCYTQYSDGEWGFFSDMDWEGIHGGQDNFVDLINYLIKTKKCTHFKVIEFVRGK